MDIFAVQLFSMFGLIDEPNTSQLNIENDI